MKNLFLNLKDRAKGLAEMFIHSKKLRYGIIIGVVAVILITVTALAAWNINKAITDTSEPIPEYDKVSVLGGGNGKGEGAETTESADIDDESEPSETETDEKTSAADDETETVTLTETEETAGTTAEPENESITPSEGNIETNEPVEVVPSVPDNTNGDEQNAGQPVSTTTAKTTQTEPKPTSTTTKATQTEPKPTPTTTKAQQTEPKPIPTTTKAQQTEPKPTPTTKETQSDPGEILGTWTVKEKKYDYNGANVMILDVENTSSSAYTITITGHFKDSSGNELKSETRTFEGFPANYSNYFVFQPGVKFDSFTFELRTSPYSGPAYAQYITCGPTTLDLYTAGEITDTFRKRDFIRAAIYTKVVWHFENTPSLNVSGDFVIFDDSGEIFLICSHGGWVGAGPLDNYVVVSTIYDDIEYNEDFKLPSNVKENSKVIMGLVYAKQR